MVEGFQEVKEILAEKGLTRCPPIALQIWKMEHLRTAAAAAAAAAPTQALASAAAMGEKSLFCPPRAKSERGVVVTDLDLRDLQILQMVGANSVCTIFEYYKLGLSMGVPHNVLTQNATKDDRMEMLVAARQMNSQLDVPDFFCDYLNRRVSVDM